MDGLTGQEMEWIKLILTSTTSVRETLLAGETPEAKMLYELCNRVESLIWHLAKRDTLSEALREVLATSGPAV